MASSGGGPSSTAAASVEHPPAVEQHSFAIGNPLGIGQTVTYGIVSALGRSGLGINTFENFIQTDAAINPGNSGGALVDTQGQLLGINTAIYSRSGGSMGIGFAIPVSTARQVLEGIVKDGMMVMCGGKERTESQWRQLLDDNGFRLARVVALPGPVSLIEVEKQ